MNISLINDRNICPGWVNKFDGRYYIGSVNYYLFQPPGVRLSGRNEIRPFKYPQIIKVLNLE
jgi:hypothetical protein